MRHEHALPLCGTALAACLLALISCVDQPDRESALSSLIAAERSFARAAAELGSRAAFIMYLADDGVLFRPRPVNAQEHLRDQPETPGTLSWAPVYADMAMSGDLGFTSGPWDFRRDTDSEPTAHGQFFSIWKRQADGGWKVVLDHGTSNPPPDSLPDGVTNLNPPPYSEEWAMSPGELNATREWLLDIDRAFSATSAARGFFHALIGYVSADVRALRNGLQPLAGVDKLRDVAAERNAQLTWTPLDGGISIAGDLGYTYGEYRYVDSSGVVEEIGLYVRAWRRTSDESWRVVVDLMTPLPADI